MSLLHRAAERRFDSDLHELPPDAEPREVHWTVRAKAEPDAYSADVELVEHSFHPGHDEVIFRGHVKWDGCANLSVPDETMPLHFCGHADFMQLAAVMREVWRAAADVMPEHADRDMFDMGEP
jgi:hypothetical protein